MPHSLERCTQHMVVHDYALCSIVDDIKWKMESTARC